MTTCFIRKGIKLEPTITLNPDPPFPFSIYNAALGSSSPSLCHPLSSQLSVPNSLVLMSSHFLFTVGPPLSTASLNLPTLAVLLELNNKYMNCFKHTFEVFNDIYLFLCIPSIYMCMCVYVCINVLYIYLDLFGRIWRPILSNEI